MSTLPPPFEIRWTMSTPCIWSAATLLLAAWCKGFRLLRACVTFRKPEFFLRLHLQLKSLNLQTQAESPSRQKRFKGYANGNPEPQTQIKPQISINPCRTRTATRRKKAKTLNPKTLSPKP